jgi:hypothetical protein
MLSDRQTSFSQMLEGLGVSSSHLTYHLESLGELVSKLDSGNYKLSTFGEAAVNTMKIVEEAPVVQSKSGRFKFFKMKHAVAALFVGLILLASFAAIQFNAFNNLSSAYANLEAENEQLLSISSGWDNASKFLRDVLELDLGKYETTLLSNAVDHPLELGGLLQQIQHYQLVSNDSRLDVTFVFRNNTLSKYQLSVTEGSPIYSKPQPFTAVDSAKWLLNKTITSYENTPYLQEMYSTVLALDTDTSSIQLTQGNHKFNMSALGANTEIQWYYSEHNVDFVQRGVKLVYENQVLKELDDGYFLYTIDNAQVNLDQAGAIQVAREAIKNYQLPSGGQQTAIKVLNQPVSVVFDPQPRDTPFALVPHWTVTLYLDTTNQQTTVNRLSVGVWADTGKFDSSVQALSG